LRLVEALPRNLLGKLTREAVASLTARDGERDQ
jgi:hypothetical protein